MPPTTVAVMQMLRDRLSFVATALVGMTGYIVWEATMSAVGASRTVVWAIASLLALAGIAWCTRSLLQDPFVLAGARSWRSGIRVLVRNHRGVHVPAIPAGDRLGWRFNDPANVVFERDVQDLVPVVRPALERTLLEVLENPLESPHQVVKGEVVYIKRLHATAADSKVIVPALLLAYTAVQRERVIRTLALARAAKTDAVGSIDEQTATALDRVVATAMERARRDEAQHPDRAN